MLKKVRETNKRLTQNKGNEKKKKTNKFVLFY